MPVEVVTEIEIGRPRVEVCAFAADPANATAWYENIEHDDASQHGRTIRLLAHRRTGHATGDAAANRKDLRD